MWINALRGNLGRLTVAACEMVRAYVAQGGLVQAEAMAQAAGLAKSEKRESAQLRKATEENRTLGDMVARLLARAVEKE